MPRSRSTRPQAHRAAQIDTLEVRKLLSATLPTDAANQFFLQQSFDGTDNNLIDSDAGSTDVLLERIAEANYSDGIGEPNDDSLPSAREVSNIVAAQSESQINDRYLTDFTWLWGQFLDHDIDLSLTTGDVGSPEDYNVEVPLGDPYFDPFGTGSEEIPLTRSYYDDTSGVREQINAITAFIDGSNVYGSSQERADALRTFEGGHLKTSDGDLLPFNEEGLDNAGGTSDSLFLAGDVRANENVGLSSLHTLWVREHNRIADEISSKNADLTDEEIYQRARRVVISELQAITYNEFLPALLGHGAIDRYSGYDNTVDPNITTEFSTAAYRLGHSLLSPELMRIGADGEVVADGNLELREAFFNPQELVDGGIDSILRGASVGLAQELDSQVIDDVRNFLFGPPGSGGLDLAALNIQRGRDHGLSSYNDTREALGLDRVESFADITSDLELQAKLEEAYGDVDSVELWVGLLSEDHTPGSSVGETMRVILVDQFTRLRDGDRFWYENVFAGERQMLDQLRSTTLKDVIERNTDIEGLQDNVFFDAGVLIHQLPDLPDSFRANRIQVAVTDNHVVVRDVPTGRALQRVERDGVKQVLILGSQINIDQVTVDVRRTDTPLEGGIVVVGGDNDRDRLSVLGGDTSDTIDVGKNSVMYGDHAIYHEGVELIDLRTLRTGDRVNITQDAHMQIMTRRVNKPVRARGDHTRVAPDPAPVQPTSQQIAVSPRSAADDDELLTRIAQSLVDENEAEPVFVIKTLLGNLRL